ncbi:response regulator [Peribacillus sp. SCS-155]|uniref:response regulator n=1 Tax=Peribacillus sedimenti TaxID=3115297 RepID=UPI003906CA40
MIKVLIVEDDPMVAEFNKRYLSEVEGYTLAGVVHNVADTIDFIQNKQVDLILLDFYMPGANGLELLSYIREHNIPSDVILITAASDTEKIQSALRMGAVDYLIKPFEFERLNQALLNYKEKFQFFTNNSFVNQEELDERVLNSEQKSSGELVEALPKGLTRTTLQVVMDVIKERGTGPFSTEDIAERTYISRVSVRKYLKFLTDLGVLEESLTYGIGRPVYLYSLKADKLRQISNLL